jgi:serine phosphatase RsbU (regulator of sigma subunit)
MPEAATLYERDFYAWTQDQAAALRALPERVRPNTLDVEHLAEEIEDLGRSQRAAAQSLIRQILIHLLKLAFHPDQRARAHWRQETREFRVQLESIFEASPSLQARRAELAAWAWARASRQVRDGLEDEDHAEAAAQVRSATSEAPYFDLDAEVLHPEWFPPRP